MSSEPGLSALDAATEAADQRIANEGGTPPTPAPEPGSAAEGTTPPAPAPAPDFENLPYRDGKKLEEELRADRERWRPYEETFGNLPEDERGEFLRTAQGLGADLPYLTSVMGGLHPDDRAYIADALALMPTDPARAGEMLAHASQALQGAGPPAGTQPSDLVDDGTPITPAQFERMMDERLQEFDQQRQKEHFTEVLLKEGRDLGYDPDSNDQSERARWNLLLDMAGETDGDLSAAHTLVEAMFQAKVDSFVAAKKADAGRPSAPTVGGSPSTERPVLTLEDAERAMEARIEGAHGQDPRRR